MIERKRRNDFVRKREFDMLRKMRRSEVMAGQDPAARPSFFQSSMPSKPDDRATTLKKIDEIEAQMSHAVVEDQAWRCRPRERGQQHELPGLVACRRPTRRALHAAAATPAPAYPKTAAGPAAAFAPCARTDPADEPGAGAGTGAAEAGAVRHAAAGLHRARAGAAPGRAVAADPDRGGAATQAPRRRRCGRRRRRCSCTRRPPDTNGPQQLLARPSSFAIDVDEFAHDPELEEASIRFANGDDAGAEAGLLEVLAPGGTRIDHDETWLTLFDLYRATGQQDRFETAAIEFASRFGRSAPQWFSLPEAVGRMGAAGRAGPVAQRAAGRLDVARHVRHADRWRR